MTAPGWDRTPLFVSLLRLSLWADGEVHRTLSAAEILYLTVAYDWMLFSHQLSDRMAKGEEVFYFCFYFLQFIMGPEFSLSARAKSPLVSSTLACEPSPAGGHLTSVQPSTHPTSTSVIASSRFSPPPDDTNDAFLASQPVPQSDSATPELGVQTPAVDEQASPSSCSELRLPPMLSDTVRPRRHDNHNGDHNRDHYFSHLAVTDRAIVARAYTPCPQVGFQLPCFAPFFSYCMRIAACYV